MIILCFQEAFDRKYVSGSTGTVVLLVDSQMLVASVGDSKALLCSAKTKNALGNEGLILPVLSCRSLVGFKFTGHC